MTNTAVALLVASPLIAWRMYSRLRRLMGRQKSIAWRHWVAAIFFPALLLLLAFTAFSDYRTLLGLVFGALVGAGLAFWGLQLTRFEATAEGLFYTPDARIGVALSLLLVGRIAYRAVRVAGASGNPSDTVQSFGINPITFMIIGILAAYYATYSVGMLRWRRSAQQIPQQS